MSLRDMDKRKVVMDRIRHSIFSATSALVHHSNDERVRREIAAIVNAMLADEINAGEIPAPRPGESATVEVTRDGDDETMVSVKLPDYLRVLFSVTHERQFEHNCDRCVFLGHGHGHDLYFCAQRSIPTVIARASSEPSDYQSGIVVARQLPIEEPLGLAYWLANREGFFAEG